MAGQQATAGIAGAAAPASMPEKATILFDILTGYRLGDYPF
jgi:hypothetical protein